MPDPLIQFLRTRTREHYDAVFKAHVGSVSRFLRRLLPQAAAEEATQDVFLQLATMRKTPEQITNAKAFILGVSLRVARDRLRADRIRSRHELNAGRLRDVASPAAYESVMLQERAGQILSAIDALPESLRLPVHLRAVEGLSYRQISKVLRLSVETVGVRICRARKKLRATLGASFGLMWIVGLPWQTDDVAMAAMENVGPKSARAAAGSAASKGAGIRLPMGLAAVCACLAILGFFSSRGDSHPQANTKLASNSGLTAQGWTRLRQAPPRLRGSPGQIRRVGGGLRAPSNRAMVERAPEGIHAESSNGSIHGSGPRAEISNMSLRELPLASAFLTFPVAGVTQGAEAGDLDGDGRITLADYLHFRKFRTGEPVAPGSYDAFLDYPCQDGTFQFSGLPMMTYLESISRGVEGALPPWIGVWSEQLKVEPLPEDPRIRIDFSTVVMPDDPNSVQLQVTLTSELPVVAFSLIFESEGGVLRMPRGYIPEGRFWEHSSWKSDDMSLRDDPWLDGDLPVVLSVPASFASGGKYVVLYGTRWWDQGTLTGGVTRFVTTGRIPVGTTAGRYKVHLAQGSEVVFEDGSLAAPTAGEEAEIIVQTTLTTGWDEGQPPLRLDLPNRRVLGKVEFRLTDSAGLPAEEGMPLVTASHEEEIALRVQMRTETPLNGISYMVSWPVESLECAGADGLVNGNGVLFRNPEDGLLYNPTLGGDGLACSSPDPWPNYQAGSFHLAGLKGYSESTYPERTIEYFKPLNEWVDLCEFRVRVSTQAKPGMVPLILTPCTHCGIYEQVVFSPYDALSSQPCEGDPDLRRHGWNYDVNYQSAELEIVGDDPPPPPPPPAEGLEIRVSDAQGELGELIEVPIFARALVNEVPLTHLRLAIEVEPDIVQVEKVAVDILSRWTGELLHKEIERGGTAILLECFEVDGNNECREGLPFLTQFVETGPDGVVVDVIPNKNFMVPYPGSEFVEIVKLLVRVQEGVTAAETFLVPGKVIYIQEGLPVEAVSGWTRPGNEGFVASSVLESGRITILGSDFLRGDANLDGIVNISDPIVVLTYLFQGGVRVECLDAADADDNGEVDITDAVFSLGAQFLGQRAIEPPYPNCGRDPSPDFLGCSRSDCP